MPAYIVSVTRLSDGVDAEDIDVPLLSIEAPDAFAALAAAPGLIAGDPLVGADLFNALVEDEAQR
jgi:hypothetical protein